jgi:peptidoglycan hydrolase-like protein with peptidoglycan-binding domain
VTVKRPDRASHTTLVYLRAFDLTQTNEGNCDSLDDDREEPMSLQAGSQGKAVADVQNALKRRGFDPGGTDGRFGPGTETAVKAFQSSRGLMADGIVGQATWEGLGLTGSVPRPVRID